MNTKMTRADELVDVLGSNAMNINDVLQILQRRHPKEPLEKLRRSVAAAVASNPGRFERKGDQCRVIASAAPVTAPESGEWPTKKAFIRAHLNMPIEELIEFAASQGIKLNKATVYTVRSEAGKQGENIEMISREEATKTTTTMVRHTEATVTKTTLVSANQDNATLDAMLIELLEEEITIGNIREKIAAAVDERVVILARQRMATMTRESAKRSLQNFFNNL